MKIINCDSIKLDPKDQALVDEIMARIDNMLSEIQRVQKWMREYPQAVECLEGFGGFQDEMRKLDLPAYAKKEVPF